jgi:hypothetical protein
VGETLGLICVCHVKEECSFSGMQI